MLRFSLLLLIPALLFSDYLIEDFEDGNYLTIDDGQWGYHSDIYESGNSRLTTANSHGKITPNSNGKASEKALHFSYILDKADYEWDPYVEIEVVLNGDKSYDASAFQGISYWYKGNAHTFSVKTRAVRDWSYHERLIPASDTWRKAIIEIPDGLAQPNWGKPVELPMDNLSGLSWRVAGTTGDSGEITLDDIMFVDTIVKVMQYDMEVRDAEIPKLDTVPVKGAITNPLQAKAQKYLNKGVSLHNWLEENAPFKDFRYDEADIKRFKEQGFEGIRFPIDIDLYVKNKAAVIAGTTQHEMDDLIWKPLDSMVNWTKKYGLSLTIDYHQYDASLNRTSVYDRGYTKMAAETWKAVATRYASNKRDDIFYELTNEPGISDDVPRDGWRVLAQEMLDSIRSVDTKHTVIYGDTRWYEIENLIKNKPFSDTNVVYSFHYYEPFLFTHQGASWTDMGSTRRTPFPYKKELWHTEYEYFGVQDGTPDWVKDQYQGYYKNGNRNAMMNQILVAKWWAVKHNVALINNEFGANPPKADPTHLVEYFRTVCGIFEELEIPWQVWFGPFDTEGELLPGMGKALEIE